MQVNEKYLITTDDWFFAPDGESYKAVFGTVRAVVDSNDALGVRTNAQSTNWYVVIGDTIIAGCQVHYAVRANDFSLKPPTAEMDFEGKRFAAQNSITRIYDADASGLVALGVAA